MDQKFIKKRLLLNLFKVPGVLSVEAWLHFLGCGIEMILALGQTWAISVPTTAPKLGLYVN